MFDSHACRARFSHDNETDLQTQAYRRNPHANQELFEALPSF